MKGMKKMGEYEMEGQKGNLKTVYVKKKEEVKCGGETDEKWGKRVRESMKWSW